MHPKSFRLALILTLLALVAGTATLTAQALTTPPGAGNQKAIVTQYMGMVSVTIDYNAPDVTSPAGVDRTGAIWGQLVPWGIAANQFYPGFGTAEEMPWRAGSNQATTITFSHDVEVEGEPVAAGTYALFMAPGEEEWTVILNSNSEAWGSFFWEPELDVAQVKVKAEKSDFFREWLTYEFDDRQLASTRAVLHWEHVRVPFSISVPNLPELYHQTISHQLTGAAGFNFQNWMNASNWAVQHEAYAEDAIAWADRAIGANASFATISNKAGILNQLGRRDEAMAALDQAIEHPTATPVLIHFAGRNLQAAGLMEDANVVFRKNYKMNPGQAPVDFGMARVYSHEGNYEKALEHARIALTRSTGVQAQRLEALIERLDKGENINP